MGAAVDQGVQGEGGVTDPAVAVVPVADPAQVLGERGGRGGHDASGRRVGERLQGDERAVDRLTPWAAHTGRVTGPFAPVADGVGHRLVGVDLGRGVLVGGEPGEDEGDLVTLGDGEVGDGGQPFPPGRNLGPEHQGVGAGDGAQLVVVPPHPRHVQAVAEADDQLHPHGHLTGQALDQADHIGLGLPGRHEVGHPDRPVRGLELLLEHQRPGQVAPGPGDAAARRSDQPPPVGGGPEEGREAGGRVEAGQAQPVDRPVPPDQRRGLGIADEGVVLDLEGHLATQPGTGAPRKPTRTPR